MWPGYRVTRHSSHTLCHKIYSSWCQNLWPYETSVFSLFLSAPHLFSPYPSSFPPPLSLSLFPSLYLSLSLSAPLFFCIITSLPSWLTPIESSISSPCCLSPHSHMPSAQRGKLLEDHVPLVPSFSLYRSLKQPSALSLSSDPCVIKDKFATIHPV